MDYVTRRCDMSDGINLQCHGLVIVLKATAVVSRASTLQQ